VISFKQVTVLAASVLVGALMSLRWSAGTTRSAVSLDQVSRTMHLLELEQAELKQTLGRLREKLSARQRSDATGSRTLDQVHEELTLQQIRAGLIDVRGPGVQVILDDGQRPSGVSEEDILVHDYDLRDVISVLWLAGAEAIAVNGERVANATSIYCVGSTVLVNDTRMSPPYQVNAIGDPVRLQDHLRNPGYLVDLRERSQRFGLQMDVVRVETMVLPAYQGSLLPRFAQPGS
jgi:uncharacterized protein YlxW (UPF0749 family)